MATIGTVNVKITGDITGLVSQLRAAGVQVEGFDKKIKSVGTGVGPALTTQARGFSNLARAFTNAAGTTGVLNSEISILASSVGNVGLLAAGAGIGIGALAAGLGAAVGASISFESAITRVAKTAGFTAEETEAFGDAISEMSTRLPVATSALTDIAVIAGQLGIEGTANIAAFVEEIAKLGSATAVDVTTLATGLGTLLQVFGLQTDAVDNLSAELTGLGNAYNSTEQAILDGAVRLAGVGAALDIPAASILAISNAIASVMPDIEAGTSAVQRVLLDIDEAVNAVETDKLQLFADVAGITADEFRKLAEARPDLAFAAFVDGLGDIDNAREALDALELSDVRVTRTLLSLAESQNSVNSQIATGTGLAIEAKATNEEFGRSSETAASKIQILKNNIFAAGREVGDTLLPAVKLALDALNSLFEGIPDFVGLVQERFGPVGGILLGIIPVFGIVLGAVNSFTADWGSVWDSITGVVQTAVVGIIEAINSMITAFNEGITGLDDFLAGANKVADKFKLGGLIPDSSGIGLIPQIPVPGFGGGGGGPFSLADVFALAAGEGIGFQNQPTTPDVNRGPVSIPPGLLPEDTGPKGPKPLTALEAAMDGIITRSEALTLGLTDQQVITLELAVAANRVADEEFRRRIELQALAQAYPGLTSEEVKFRLGLEAIAENLRETNRTAEQFNLEEALRPALERVESAFSGLFEKPSREQAQLQLRIDQLELKRSEAKAKGKSDEQLKAIDRAIEAVRLQKDILDQRSDILKDEAVLADQTLLTEKERTFAAALYTIAIKDGSTAVDRATAITTLQTIAQENYIRSLNNASGALGGSADPFTPEQKRWINGVARSRNEAEPFPGFATGIDFVPRDMIANIHRGERIIPASQNIRGESGTTGANIAYVTINAQGEIAEATARKLAREVTRTLKEELDIETLSGQRLPVGVYSSR